MYVDENVKQKSIKELIRIMKENEFNKYMLENISNEILFNAEFLYNLYKYEYFECLDEIVNIFCLYSDSNITSIIDDYMDKKRIEGKRFSQYMEEQKERFENYVAEDISEESKIFNSDPLDDSIGRTKYTSFNLKGLDFYDSNDYYSNTDYDDTDYEKQTRTRH